jgi:hypothetical protein
MTRRGVWYHPTTHGPHTAHALGEHLEGTYHRVVRFRDQSALEARRPRCLRLMSKSKMTNCPSPSQNAHMVLSQLQTCT